MIRGIYAELVLLKGTLRAAIKGEMKFALKNILHRFTPGGYGYISKVRRAAKNLHIDERPPHKPNDGTDYSAYLAFQAHKYNEILYLYGGFDNRKLMKWRLVFFDSLYPLVGLLEKDAKILCVGARQGTEVEVLRDLGFRHALGCDLNPGPENPLVVEGDFMNHKYHDKTFDAVYSNAVDHAFDLDEFFAEQSRILKDGGYAVFDFVTDGFSEYEFQYWECVDEPVEIASRVLGKVVGKSDNGRWCTVTFKK